MKCKKRFLPGFLLLALTTAPAPAQNLATCRSGSNAELEAFIAAHEEHNYRLYRKFLHEFYYQGRLPSDFSPAKREDILRFLHKLAPRKASVLVHAFDSRRGCLCTWLITAQQPAISQVKTVSNAALQSLAHKLRQALGVSGMEGNRAPMRKGETRNVRTPESSSEAKLSLEETIKTASEILLPPTIARALLANGDSILIIVPIRDFGAMPFPILRLGGQALVEKMSIVIAPGFFVFTGEPIASPRDFSDPIIMGDPNARQDSSWTFPALPGARAEAEAVAELLDAQAYIDSAASIKNFTVQLAQRPNPKLVYLATHGISDDINPRDASFLLMSDGHWPAADIQNLPLQQARPLVILSACQTGLGKDFEVGTIGMTRAWQRAGAASVVMSLWNVDDLATARLMTAFIQLAKTWPVDKALQLAMLQTRDTDPKPASWAGFSVFGAPGY